MEHPTNFNGTPSFWQYISRGTTSQNPSTLHPKAALVGDQGTSGFRTYGGVGVGFLGFGFFWLGLFV